MLQLHHRQSRSLAFLPRPSEGTYTEPRKSNCEANCHSYPSGSRLPRMIFHALANQFDAAENCDHQKDDARNLKPQLV
jgi:hypothetical protein